MESKAKDVGPRHDPSASLLSEHDESKPVIEISFSTVNLLRLGSIPVTIAAFILQCDNIRGLGRSIAACTFGVLLWDIVRALYSISSKKGGITSLRVGGFICSFGREERQLVWTPTKKRSYVVNLVDLVVGGWVLFQAIFAWKTRSIHREHLHDIGVLCFVVSSLHFAMGLLGAFPIFQKARIAVYDGENSENGYQAASYRDDEASQSGRPVSIA